MRVLVTGGIRSGKSRHAESLLLPGSPLETIEDGRPRGTWDPRVDPVTYLAAGPQRDDADWAARVAAHRARRPDTWLTLESTDAAAGMRAASGPVLLDCLGTWLTAQLDEIGAWAAPETDWAPDLEQRVSALEEAWRATPFVVGVTNEVGWGLVSEHRSGRIFADRLGWLNERIASASDRVDLVVSGQVLTIKAPA
ncbi:bifunctional adenosylcobinamide kinase/adenosylcobinamide-phosphate guanylyltransferase [Janibacter hoylei]|uniref:bifunctional adenosylcobinamide kinase/adenosylcobinamide-phosphate guanylyltransferase n=1 Tax=Janibacter hoylei TaxID=364298 RepID=UPI0021A88FFA|nr:bifunctional adenosylcobinamide kinase/adenosylcobinamide-phosphate guanylyltransferase [Janibacter hoylei]MCT1618694.1 bifunctional adenosylcobinamide kinase/adenosylcobinamide-phosphate guanylyltransferase [Janibacter hoylei]MCT2291968.1 bifunctional adenosylcobinamide kinase/adenosylcobinamide-phosphate guanylyltransferase [Janibacter hoylei]